MTFKAVDWADSATWIEIDDASGFITLVGPIWRSEGSYDRYRFVVEERHLNLGGVVQGGMLLTFADRALAELVKSEHRAQRQATIQLDMHFIDGATLGETIIADCRILRRTKNLAFVEADLWAEARLIASAKGVWKIMA